MPIYIGYNSETKKEYDYYDYILVGQLDWDDEYLDELKRRRKEFSRCQEEFMNFQKEFSQKKEYDKAKSLKDIIKYYQRKIKAINIWLDWWNGNRKDQTFKDFPVELYEELDEELHVYWRMN